MKKGLAALLGEASVVVLLADGLQHILRQSKRAQVDIGVVAAGGDAAVAEALAQRISEVFATDPKCRRVIVPVEPDNVEEISACEDAGMRYVLDVQLRTGEEHALMVAEPDWVANQSTDTKNLELT